MITSYTEEPLTFAPRESNRSLTIFRASIQVPESHPTILYDPKVCTENKVKGFKENPGEDPLGRGWVTISRRFGALGSGTQLLLTTGLQLRGTKYTPKVFQLREAKKKVPQQVEKRGLVYTKKACFQRKISTHKEPSRYLLGTSSHSTFATRKYMH